MHSESAERLLLEEYNYILLPILLLGVNLIVHFASKLLNSFHCLFCSKFCYCQGLGGSADRALPE